MDIKNCLNCKKDFSRPLRKGRKDVIPNHIWLPRKFCSRRCASEYRVIHRIKEKYPNEKRCLECRKIFIRPSFKRGLQDLTGWKKRQFCSTKCSRTVIGRISRNKTAVTQGTHKVCEGCGERFERSKDSSGIRYTTNAHWKKQRFCSTACNIKYNIKKSDTDIEKLIEAIFVEKEIVFEKQKKFGRMLVDFYLPDFNTVIECDGDYWHNRLGAPERDARKTKALKEMGFKVLRFWGKEIYKSPIQCVNQLYI